MSKTAFQQIKFYRTSYLRVGYDINDIETEEHLEMIVYQDKHENILKTETFSAENELEMLILNEFNENNKLISTVEFDNSGELLRKIEHIYNENGDVEQENTFYGEESPKYVRKMVFENNQIVREESYIEEEFENVDKRYFYDNNNLLIKEIYYSDEGAEQYILDYTYNDDKTLKQLVRNEVLAKDRRTYEYSYDDLKRRIKELTYNYKNELIAKQYFKYDANNQVIEIEAENLDTYTRITYDYDGILMVKNSNFDKNGDLQSWIDYFYNENGVNISQSQHVKDEVDPKTFRKVYELRQVHTLLDE